MSSEFLEKIRNILEHLFVLFIFILIMLITFGSLHVHAEESTGWGLSSNAGNYYHSGTYTDQWGNECSVEYYSVLPDSNYFYGFVRSDASVGEYDNVYLYSLVRYQLGSGQTPAIWDDMNKYDNYFFNRKSGLDDKAYSQQTFETYYFKNGSEYVSTFNCSSGSKLYIYSVQPEKYGKKYHEVNLSFSLPVFDSYDAMLKYCLAGDTSGLVNGGSIDNPDFQDAAYAFTGFTANNKMTATWTGTTERTYLQDQEVEEYVRVNYYFADKEAQDTIKQANAYPDEFATADKTLTIDVSGLKPDNENWFLRYIRITPCYRQAGLGAWGDFYHGEPSYVYFNQDGSIDRIDAPYIKGELSIDMERPVIVLHEAANGNPTESDFSYFEFNNAQSDYFFEMKGRWYTTNDFDLYRDKLVWKYKYSTLLKNNLSTWVSVSDNRSSVGRFQFDVLGKSSWDNLLSSYPVDDRNYIGGSYNLFNKITGYSDALETLKMLLKQPYSLFNGYEVYVRYFRYDENGGIQYSKWTHFYNNLADSDGSSGSRLDDLDNMYSENQSDKGLTDDELSDLENGGNSRNDLDAVPKNNYDYSSLENATMNFFDLLKNFGTMLGQFPSMVAAVFGFLPPWLIGLIAVAIGAVIVCRFIGR